MHPYVGPLVIAVLGVLLRAAPVYGVGPDTLAWRNEDQIESMRRSFSSRARAASLLVLPGYATYSLLISIWTGREGAWAWLACLVIQVACVYVAVSTQRRFFEITRLEPWRPDEQDLLRSRYARIYLGVAFLSFVTARILLPQGGGGVTAWRGGIAVSLMVVALLGFLAAGWSTVWVFRSRMPSGAAG
jgi:hypothetical protein